MTSPLGAKSVQKGKQDLWCLWHHFVAKAEQTDRPGLTSYSTQPLEEMKEFINLLVKEKFKLYFRYVVNNCMTHYGK